MMMVPPNTTHKSLIKLWPLSMHPFDFLLLLGVFWGEINESPK